MKNKHLRVHVQAIEESCILLTLPNGETLKWPTEEKISSFAVGDELILTLTHSRDVVNELLGNTAQQ